MRAGKLRHRVTIQSASETQPDSNMGQPVESWSDFATVWAHVEPLHGRERMVAQERTAELDTRITIRYLSGVLAKMRVIYGSHTYDILAVINLDERDREMQLMCKEVDV